MLSRSFCAEPARSAIVNTRTFCGETYLRILILQLKCRDYIRLHCGFGAGVILLIGGCTAGNYQHIIEEVGAIRIYGVLRLRLELDIFRTNRL